MYFPQFVRAYEELGIQIILALRAQAKGPIERTFRTMQERFVPELNFLGIVGMTDANRNRELVFLP